ncbi:MAG: HDOD domain-containing protein [Chromatiaceae bacterium]|nr:MAG: HDOD domain-containing protein [Chromatiaceae bacterium]
MADLVMSQEEERIMGQLMIPSQPTVLRAIAAEVEKEEGDLIQVARLVSEDVSVSGGILLVVNSPLFRRRREISSIREAVMLLGLQRVYSVARTVALRNALSHLPRMHEFWKSSVTLAEACGAAARRVKRPDLVDDAYLVGLFHLVGVPALRSVFGEAYESVERQADLRGWHSAIHEEQRRYGVSHDRLGALITQRWRAPTSVIQATAHQYQVQRLDMLVTLHPDARDLLVMLKLALRATTAVDPARMTYADWEATQDFLADYLALDVQSLDALVDELN